MALEKVVGRINQVVDGDLIQTILTLAVKGGTRGGTCWVHRYSPATSFPALISPKRNYARCVMTGRDGEL
jgi:hypothetical protein